MDVIWFYIAAALIAIIGWFRAVRTSRYFQAQLKEGKEIHLTFRPGEVAHSVRVNIKYKGDGHLDEIALLDKNPGFVVSRGLDIFSIWGSKGNLHFEAGLDTMLFLDGEFPVEYSASNTKSFDLTGLFTIYVIVAPVDPKDSDMHSYSAYVTTSKKIYEDEALHQ